MKRSSTIPSATAPTACHSGDPIAVSVRQKKVVHPLVDRIRTDRKCSEDWLRLARRNRCLGCRAGVLSRSGRDAPGRLIHPVLLPGHTSATRNLAGSFGPVGSRDRVSFATVNRMANEPRARIGWLGGGSPNSNGRPRIGSWTSLQSATRPTRFTLSKAGAVLAHDGRNRQYVAREHRGPIGNIMRWNLKYQG